MPPPAVAIVGAPNVGKSTLFNRMLGRRQAIVSDQPGVTRDRIAAVCDLFGTAITLVDTGGVVTGQTDDLTRRVRDEALKAVSDAEVILFVIDARSGLTATDLEVAAILRASHRPVVPVANKIDAASLEGHAYEMYRLGLGEVVAISAEQGRGLDELVERIRGALPRAGPGADQPGVPLAIVGRPNVGKSSLFNRLLEEDRAVVAPLPGTTRDPVDAVFRRGEVDYRIVDTAGIRRRASAGEEIERVSVLKARQVLEEAEIAIALVDASAGLEHQDLAILGLLTRSRVPAVLGLNKIDRLGGSDAALAQAALRDSRAALTFAPYIPMVPLSALTGEGVEELLVTLDEVRAESRARFATGDLNRALAEIVREKQPPADGGHPVRFYYVTQTGGTPPGFAVFGNGRDVKPPYRRFMEAGLRRRLGLTRTPLRLQFKRRKGSR